MNAKPGQATEGDRQVQFQMLMIRCLDNALACLQRDACRIGCHEAEHFIACARDSLADAAKRLTEDGTAIATEPCFRTFP